MLNAESRIIQIAKCKIQNPDCKIQIAKCRMHFAIWILDSVCILQNHRVAIASCGGGYDFDFVGSSWDPRCAEV